MSEEDGLQRPTPGKLAKFIKVSNIVVGLLIIALAILSFFSILSYLSGFRIFMAISPVCMLLLGILQMCVEFNIKWVVNNFRFMDNLFGKGLFMIFLSSVLYCILEVAEYNDAENFAICLVPLVTGIIYSVLHCWTCGKYNQELKERLV